MGLYRGDIFRWNISFRTCTNAIKIQISVQHQCLLWVKFFGGAWGVVGIKKILAKITVSSPKTRDGALSVGVLGAKFYFRVI